MADNYGQVSETLGEKFKPIGITLIILGSCSMLFEIISVALWISSAITYGDSVNINAPGIYIGILTIITGSMALKSSKAATKCTVVAGLVLGILLLPGSMFMNYYEGSSMTEAITNSLSGQAATHGLTLICGIGIVITDAIFLFFTSRAQKLAG